MNKIFIAFFIGLFGLTLHSNAQVGSGLAKYLTELEANMKLDAFDEKWEVQRGGWIARCEMAGTDITKTGAQLLALEARKLDSAVESDWAKRRGAWINEVTAAKNVATLGKLMLELESNVKWEAVEDAWKDRREKWIAEVEALK